MPEVRWALAGDGPQHARLAQHAEEAGLGRRIAFLGHIDYVDELIAEATLVASAATSEGLGSTLLDAMAIGRPIVATAVGGVPDLLASGSGVLVPNGDAAALATRDRARAAGPGGGGRHGGGGTAGGPGLRCRRDGRAHDRGISFGSHQPGFRMIYVCIPSHNEAPTVGLLLWKVRQVFSAFEREYQLLVGDDGSTDATSEILQPYTRALPLTVIRSEERRGYARTVESLLRAGGGAH